MKDVSALMAWLEHERTVVQQVVVLWWKFAIVGWLCVCFNRRARTGPFLNYSKATPFPNPHPPPVKHPTVRLAFVRGAFGVHSVGPIKAHVLPECTHVFFSCTSTHCSRLVTNTFIGFVKVCAGTQGPRQWHGALPAFAAVACGRKFRGAVRHTFREFNFSYTSKHVEVKEATNNECLPALGKRLQEWHIEEQWSVLLFDPFMRFFVRDIERDAVECF